MAASVVVLGWIFMAISGVFLAIQSGVNLTLGSHIGKSLGAVVSFGTGLVALLIFFLVDTTAFHSPLPTKSGAAGAPWWAWFGGPLGAFYVASIIIFAPKLGAANSLGIFVVAQLIMALILDYAGLAGYPRRTFHWQRILGLVLLIAGVVLVVKYQGSVVQSKTDSSTDSAAKEGPSVSASHVSMGGAQPPSSDHASDEESGTGTGSSSGTASPATTSSTPASTRSPLGVVGKKLMLRIR